MHAPINRTMAPVEWALLFVLAMLWGGSFFFNVLAIAALPTLAVVAARLTIGAVFLYAAARVSGARLPTDAPTWVAFAGMGILNNVIPFSLIVWAQGTVASGLASILNATTPLFAVLVAHTFASDERMTPASVGGVLIGFAGVAILMGADTLTEGHTNLVAELAILVASLSYAFSAVYGRRFSRMGLAPLAAATGQITTAAIIMVPLAFIIDRPWNLAPPPASAWVRWSSSARCPPPSPMSSTTASSPGQDRST